MNALDGVIFDIRTHNKKILRELKKVIKNWIMVSSLSRKYEFRVFSIVHLNIYNF